MLGNRLRKQYQHLRKWAKRQQLTCYRLYERDIPEIPAIVDWVDGDVLLWLYPRQKDETPEQQNQFREECLEQVSSGLGVNQSQIFLKERGRQIEGKQYQRLSQNNRTKIVSEKDLK
ncbi:MAG: hypothetical protein AABZ14_01220, partial [Candidatus Margulisiibacteriota bacterium]